ncbi:FIST N-terminal domain-containing protein [Pricia sp. S334]|uniref:FIST N-terminal domain-containing protein n=1 Tax=Pricia mediterranea TaxID=3076079 RepID=A0ABU3L238_9FLAO|nr:FIST N-terminal domain-containing protein [Pricia sp. S334]MDT7827333.1 FIST N-terminal domain-containing protein [Pricia sp. S334]
MKAKSIKGDSPQQIAERLNRTISDGFKPTLAIVFLSIKQDREAICQLLDEKGIAIFGATTAGEFIDGDIGEESAAIMLLDIDAAFFKVSFVETGNGHTRDLARQIGEEGLKMFNNPAYIMVSGGISTDGEMIIRGIEDAMGEAVTIFGGMAGDDFTMTGTYVFTNKKCSDNALTALIIDEDRISVKGLATSGWRPVGTVRTITKSKGNVIHTIDHEPALDVVIKYMGVSKDLDGWKDVIVNVGSEFPMQLQREGRDPVLRAPLFANKTDRSLTCAGSVPQGSKIRFSLPPTFDVIDKVVAECEEIKNHDQQNGDAMIMFSCKARHLSLGPMVSDEINQVKEVWDVPLVGFFSYGEMGKATKGKHEFHNNTCSLVVLAEL